ncbi:MAG: hypothetical protein WCA44_18090 [Acidobacteriaceae bacterium]
MLPCVEFVRVLAVHYRRKAPHGGWRSVRRRLWVGLRGRLWPWCCECRQWKGFIWTDKCERCTWQPVACALSRLIGCLDEIGAVSRAGVSLNMR